ncbi:hypothetical protein GS887_26635 [Rhodococcus hoagii]|nr:hypothetical protein [Prescottella equi]NKU37524.1 hypothetical protein [Prescottella equi]
MRIDIRRSAVVAAVPALLLVGCSTVDSEALREDSAPRSINCRAIPFANAVREQKAKPSPQGVESVALVTNTAEEVAFDINFAGASDPDAKLILDIATDSTTSPPIPDETNGNFFRSDSAGIYSLVVRPGANTRVAEFYYEGNPPEGFSWPDLASFVTVAGNPRTVRVTLNPATLPELPAGKNFGYSLVLTHPQYRMMGCSDAVPQ